MAINTLRKLHDVFKTKCSNVGLEPTCISSGAIISHIAVVSAYPGLTEVKTGIPFTGPAGGHLWDALRKYGVTRSDCYVTNVIKRLVQSRGEDPEHVSTSEVALWEQLLKWELSQLPNLRHILILGNEALVALTPVGGILNWRGSWVEVLLDNRAVDALVTVNPAMVLNSDRVGLAGGGKSRSVINGIKKVFEFDCKKFRMLIDGNFTKYVTTELVLPTFDQAMDFLHDRTRTDTPLCFDIETANGETACVGFADGPHEAMCIPFINADLSPYWSSEQELEIRRAIARVLQTHPRLIAQNGMYDTIWLWFKDKIRPTVWFDTLLAHHTLYPSLPHSLQFLCSRYTTHPFYKDEKDDWRSVGDIERYWRYNAKDCCITYAVYMALLGELLASGLKDFFFNHVMRVQPHLALMSVGGIRIDEEYKATLADELEAELVELLRTYHLAVYRVTNDPMYKPNPLSVRDTSELFFRRLKLVGRGTSTDEDNRERMRKHPRTTPEAKAVLDAHDTYVKLRKFFGTYVESEVDKDGRLRCEYRQWGTARAPGRLSSSSTPWGTGSNLQNQPHRAYNMFITGVDDDYVFFYFDLEQAEARVVGWLANIPHWIEDFERARITGDYDCHRALAASMWNIPYDEVPKKDVDLDGKHTIRYVAKRCRHGLNYRMMADRLSVTTGLPPDVAIQAFNAYHRVNPQLRQWWKSLEQEVRRTGMLHSLYGRRWVLVEPISDQALESIVAFKPQSTIGDKVNEIIYLSHEDDDWPVHARAAMNIHDAVVGIAPRDKAKTCLSIMKRHAERPHYITGMPPLIIPASCKMSQSATAWRLVENGSGSREFEFYDSDTGYQRWGNLSEVDL